MDPLIYGRETTKHIVSCEVVDDTVEIFTEHNGVVSSALYPNSYYILAAYPIDSTWQKLEGSLHYSYIKYYDTQYSWYKAKQALKYDDVYVINDAKEMAMCKEGFTYYKDTKVQDVSVLFFDIESMGLVHNGNSRVLLISNTFVKNGEKTKKLFSYDEYENDKAFLDAWCTWVRSLNPSILAGHNIFGYDLPYMEYCAKKADTELFLGRDGSSIKFNKYTSKFRKDGSQDYDYTRCFIYGREIVDTMFVAYHFDFARKYESYALKQIIKQEGLEIAGRQFYDAGNISKNYLIPEEWEKIKKYAEHDADDAAALYFLMIPAYFYMAQYVPKSFQTLNYSASGSQLNSFLVRSYLQDGHSVPKASPPRKFEGAISMGWPGVYKNVYKLDIAALYPSIMIEYNIYDKFKDPKAHFAKMVSYFTHERLKNKKLAKDTGERYYKEVEQSGKTFINSAYGLLGSVGLAFNSPKNAELVTAKGREILTKGMDWAKENKFILANVDTDSISITNNEFISMDKRKELTDNINSIFPEKIKWTDDGYYRKFIVLRAKNYILQTEEGKIKIKGSALKSSKTEKGLKEFMGKIIECLLDDKPEEIMYYYTSYIREFYNMKDISRWCSKKTLTEKVLNPERTNEQRIFNCIEGMDVQMGDKILTYFREDGNLQLMEKWENNHDKLRLIEKLYKTLCIFENVLDVSHYPKYHLKKQKEALNVLVA